MGACSSCESVSVATAKLILQDGKLMEFPYSIKISYLLQKYPSCFICNSDSLEFGNFVSAMHGSEELLPGQLYFALPLSRLRYPLQPEEMAALAVKASLALVNRKDAYGHCLEEAREMFGSDIRGQDQRRSNGQGNSLVSGMGKKSRKSICKGSGHIFTSSLPVIQE